MCVCVDEKVQQSTVARDEDSPTCSLEDPHGTKAASFLVAFILPNPKAFIVVNILQPSELTHCRMSLWTSRQPRKGPDPNGFLAENGRTWMNLVDSSRLLQNVF